MIGTQYTLVNKAGESIVLNDHTTTPSQIIALQQYPQMDVSVKNNQINKAGQHGNWDFFSYYGNRAITFSGVIVGLVESDVDTVRSQLLKVLALPAQPSDTLNGYVTITWTDPNGEDWQIEAKLTRPAQFSRAMKQTYKLDFNFTLIASDPYIVSQTLKTGSGTKGYVDGGGLTIPLSLPFSWSETNVNVLTVTNLGTVSAQTLIRLNGHSLGAITNPTIENLTTGTKFTVNTTLADETKWIEIDSQAGTVVDQDGLDLTGLVTNLSEFALLQPDSNEMFYTSDEIPSNTLYIPTATFSVKYRDTTI